MSIATEPLSLTVNGRDTGPIEVPDGLMMLDFLNEYLNLTGARLGCGIGVCHACTIIVDGPDGRSEEVRTCITGAHSFAGRRIRTVEGLADGERLHAVQQAYLEHHAFQCSFCTPGFLMATVALLEENPNPSDDQICEYLAGNLCRCGAYPVILEAVRALAQAGPK